MSNMRYYFRLILAYISRFKGIMFFGILLGAAIFLIITIASSRVFSVEKETVGLTGRYRTDELPYYILDMISDGLTKVNEAGIAEPSLSYSWDSPDKGKTWTFHLKDNISWQDEDIITSNEIVYEFSDVTVERPDEKTISFKLKDPFVPFPVVVSRPAFKKGLLGMGEWKVEKISIVGNYVEELVLLNDNKGKKIFKFYPTTDATKLAFKLGQVDKIEEILDATPFSSWNTTIVKEKPNKNQVVVLFFNTQDKLLGGKSFRQALTYAIDKEKLGTRAISPIAPDSFAYNPQVKPYDYDSQRALELFDELPKELRQNLEVKLIATPTLLTTAEKISKDWQALGVKTTVQVSSIIPTEFQAYLTILDIPKDPDQYPIWHSTQTSSNLSKYANPRIDKLLEDGRSELSTEERRRIYLDFQRFLLEDLPAAFLYHPTYYTISRK